MILEKVGTKSSAGTIFLTPPNMKEVTVVIPCYNQSQFLLEAVESCLHQSQLPKRIIILLMDKESWKLEVMLNNLSPLIRVIRSARKSLPSARNFCIGIAITEYVLPLDADDTLPPDFIKEACKIDADVVYVGSKYFGAHTGWWPPTTAEEIDWDKQTTLRRNPIVCSALIKRSAWATVGGYSDTLTAYEDMEFWIRLHEYNFIFKKCFTTFLNYRKHAETSMLKDVSSDPNKWVPLYAEVIRHHPQYYGHIPKIIHYVWLGNNPKPIELIDAWKQCLPKEWEIKEWNETNIPFQTLPQFSREAVTAKKYGIAVDPIRAYLLYTYGGVWLDTDCVLKRDITPFCQYDLIVGHESVNWLNVGLVGACKSSLIMKQVLEYYQRLTSYGSALFNDPQKFIDEVGTGPQVLTRIMQNYAAFKPNGMPQTLQVNNERLRIEPACVFTLNDEMSGAHNFAQHLYTATWTDKVSNWAAGVQREYDKWKDQNNITIWRG